MIKIERTSVMNFENAIRGARNPMNSWGRMDSHTEPDGTFVGGISMSHSSTSMRSRSKTLCASFTLYAVNTCSTGIFFQFTPITMLSTTSGWSSTINTFIR